MCNNLCLSCQKITRAHRKMRRDSNRGHNHTCRFTHTRERETSKLKNLGSPQAPFDHTKTHAHGGNLSRFLQITVSFFYSIVFFFSFFTHGSPAPSALWHFNWNKCKSYNFRQSSRPLSCLHGALPALTSCHPVCTPKSLHQTNQIRAGFYRTPLNSAGLPRRWATGDINIRRMFC